VELRKLLVSQTK